MLTARIPENVTPGSLHARVKIYPNLLAHVVENLEAGLEKPNGCGEQTISSTYPSLLARNSTRRERLVLTARICVVGSRVAVIRLVARHSIFE